MSAYFVEDMSLVDRNLSAPLLDVACSTLLICSTLCLRVPRCLGLSFRETTRSCRLHESFVPATTVLGNRVMKVVKCPLAEPRPGVYCLPSCYCIMTVNMKVNWDTAMSYCANESTYLAKVDTRERLDFVLSILDTQGVSNCWAGGYLTTNNTWQWLDGTLVDPSLIALGKAGDCVNVWRNRRTLDDASRNRQFRFVCQIDTL